MRLLQGISAPYFPVFIKTVYSFKWKWQLYQGLKRGCECFY
jgi:hypothetical protein